MPPAFTFALIFIVLSFGLLSYALIGSSRKNAQSPSMMPPAFTFALTFMMISLFSVLLRRGAAFIPNA